MTVMIPAKMLKRLKYVDQPGHTEMLRKGIASAQAW
jgi:hypothetical protein